jgi:hypothetical protein
LGKDLGPSGSTWGSHKENVTRSSSVVPDNNY